MTSNNLVDTIQERLIYYKEIIANLETKNANLARLACTYAFEADRMKTRSPEEYWKYHRIDLEDWL